MGQERERKSQVQAVLDRSERPEEVMQRPHQRAQWGQRQPHQGVPEEDTGDARGQPRRGWETTFSSLILTAP